MSSSDTASDGSVEVPPLTFPRRTFDEAPPPRPVVYNVMLCALCGTTVLAVAAIIVAVVVIAAAVANANATG